MSKPRKLRSSSISTEVSMASAELPSPPDWIALPAEAKPVWEGIVRARDYKSWTQIDLEHAANLACCLSDLERLRREVRVEGDVIENARGTPVMNPKHALMETLSRRSVALSRLLHVHAEATVGESRHQTKRSEKQREMAQHMEEIDGDELIASPMH